jgi:hypothetical protein
MTLETTQISASMGERWKAGIKSAPAVTPHAATSMLRSTWTRSLNAFAYGLSARIAYVSALRAQDG